MKRSPLFFDDLFSPKSEEETKEINKDKYVANDLTEFSIDYNQIIYPPNS